MKEQLTSSQHYFDALLELSSQFAKTVRNEVKQLPVDTERMKLAVLLLASALTHHGAINLLLDDGRYAASALALTRSVADAAFRAIWIAKFATDDEVSLALKSSDDPKLFKWPNPRTVTELIQAKFKQNDPDELEFIKMDWRHMSGSVHTGSSQLRNRLKGYDSRGYPVATQVKIILKSSLYLNHGARLVAIAVPAFDIAKRIDTEFEALVDFAEKVLESFNEHRKSTIN